MIKNIDLKTWLNSNINWVFRLIKDVKYYSLLVKILQSCGNNIKWIYNLSALQKEHWYNLMDFLENITGILSMILGTHRKSRKSTLETWPLISKSYHTNYTSIHTCMYTQTRSFIYMHLCHYIFYHLISYYTIKECKRESHVTILCLFVVCL